MDLSKFTEKGQEALQEAQSIATRNQHQAVDVEHLMLALLEQEGGLAPRLFEKSGVAPGLLRARLEEQRLSNAATGIPRSRRTLT